MADHLYGARQEQKDVLRASAFVKQHIAALKKDWRQCAHAEAGDGEASAAVLIVLALVWAVWWALAWPSPHPHPPAGAKGEAAGGEGWWGGGVGGEGSSRRCLPPARVNTKPNGFSAKPAIPSESGFGGG